VIANLISFVSASSNSGKTTLIEKIIPILKDRSVRIAVVKHASDGFQLDIRGKDSWRYRNAGADSVLLVGPDTLAYIGNTNNTLSLNDLERFVNDVDIVIVEGFKNEAKNKIEVYRHGISDGGPLCMDDREIIALVSDRRRDVPIPWFDLDDAMGVADFIMTFLKERPAG
jgi:molybdopterin-guanine dinucleotide biosynthesis protein B